MRLIKIIGTLAIVYYLSWFLLAGIGLSNNRTEGLLELGKWVMFFIKNILGFPMNLVNSTYPFLMDNTGKMLDSDLNPILLIAINFILQIGLIYWIWEIIKKLPTTMAKKHMGDTLK